MSPPVVITLLTLLLGIQPITTDLYLPALPTLAKELHGRRVSLRKISAELAVISPR